ncbi:hypothetical protein [Massilia orientalis]|uniref:Uncharacterized protein n=1 Tax=Massilia orientalis TaxID=3050128 RepID=A0ACC7MM36_9BURK|nr:hypothetical protein [Massilia sp. YIM B02787]
MHRDQNVFSLELAPVEQLGSSVAVLACDTLTRAFKFDICEDGEVLSQNFVLWFYAN